MLAILIYRSRICAKSLSFNIDKLVSSASRINKKQGITGVLMFDGTYFLQILEGGAENVDQLYAKIKMDRRHHHIVELMRDYAPRRSFPGNGMAVYDMRSVRSANDLMRELVAIGISRDERMFGFIRAFVSGQWKEKAGRIEETNRWLLTPGRTVPLLSADNSGIYPPCKFALQPIVSPSQNRICSFEALIRSPDGGTPQYYFSSIPENKIHEADIYSKIYAFELASKIGLGDEKISINLLPMSLVDVPGAVDILLGQIRRCNLSPEQVIIEVTEDEVISRFDAFSSEIKRLRSEGFGLAIDDFGAGFAGLSLLTKFQPGSLKIDKCIVENVHADGVKQAVVQAIISCCNDLSISIVAEGVEKTEEWEWLNAAGIKYFQGFLFARPSLNGIPEIRWPVINDNSI